jgi:hypothetical protein
VKPYLRCLKSLRAVATPVTALAVRFLLQVPVLLSIPFARRIAGANALVAVATSNHRLISLNDDQVAFRWRASAHNNEQKVMSLSLDEFLTRFLLHLLPKGFVRIRHFGFLANRA